MEVYIYKAALYCAPCGTKICEELRAVGKQPANVQDERTYDSDDYPKGPTPNGGGDADSPQHCDACNKFLENPLTSDGEEYLNNEVADAIAKVLRGTRETISADSALGQWIAFYDVKCNVYSGQEHEHAELDADDLIDEGGEPLEVAPARRDEITICDPDGNAIRRDLDNIDTALRTATGLVIDNMPDWEPLRIIDSGVAVCTVERAGPKGTRRVRIALASAGWVAIERDA
jgi:hypothetical protein